MNLLFVRHWVRILTFPICCSLVEALPPHAIAADSGGNRSKLAVAPAYHYEPVPGKLVGVWPDFWTTERMTELRLQYGFSGVLLLDAFQQYQAARDAGFNPATIMASVEAINFTPIVDTFEAGFYYVDEPVEHNCSGQPSGGRFKSTSDLEARDLYIASHRPGAKFVIDGYKRCSHNIIAAGYAEVMMYSSYVNWSKFGLPWCHVNMGWGEDYENPWSSGSGDQRDSWTDMQRVFGAKFSMTWLNAGGDEYDLLLGHAANLGLQGVWLYSPGPIDLAKLESFCAAAVAHGWLVRVDGPPLPIQLASFVAHSSSHDMVTLQWATLSEIQSYGFVVQRRPDGLQRFTDIPGGFVAGQGSTIVPHDYVFTDSTAGAGRWWYRLKMIDLDGTFSFSDPVVVDVVTGIEREPLPGSVVLYQNYPNPFNPETEIRWNMMDRGMVKLTVYDLLGREVTVLVQEVMQAGSYSVRLNASNLNSGTYLYRLQTGNVVATRRMVLLK